MSKFLTALKNHVVNVRGFHTKRHLLVIESDDWGSIRTPSAETLVRLREQGDEPEKDAFLRNDNLENEKDLGALFDVLKSICDSKGKPCVMTSNFVMANPDFDRIDYFNEKYAYEPFYETYNRYYGENTILSMIKSAYNEGLFCPQLHCREHLNVNRWMKALKNGKKDAITAFENRMIGIGASFSDDNVFGYMDAFNTDETDGGELAKIVYDAASVFEKTFGYNSKTFVASCFVWHPSLEKALKNIGVEGIQSAMWQNVPKGNNGKYKLKRKLRYTGEKSSAGQVYTVRNCKYEPSLFHNPEESAKQCLGQIERAFENGKPAIINSHRLNYISSVNENNSEKNLEGLKVILEGVVKKYNDVEFVSTPELVELIKGTR